MAIIEKSNSVKIRITPSGDKEVVKLVDENVPEKSLAPKTEEIVPEMPKIPVILKTSKPAKKAVKKKTIVKKEKVLTAKKKIVPTVIPDIALGVTQKVAPEEIVEKNMTAKEIVTKEIANVDKEFEKEIIDRVPALVVQDNRRPDPLPGSRLADINAKNALPETKKSRPLGLYKKIAFLFGFLTIVLVSAVLYFAFVKVDIILIPNQERVSNNLIFDIYDKDKNKDVRQGAITGAVLEKEISESIIAQSTGLSVVGEELAGKVTIINNYNNSQPLVAKTRLLSADNKLFRLKNTVTVPAGSSLEVDVYADKISEAMSIKGPMKWTIPGLWAGLQDKIYAESKDDILYQKMNKKIITQADIDGAIKDAKSALLVKVKEGLGDIYKNYNQVISQVDENAAEINVDGKAGEERENFTVSVKTNVRVVAFNEEAIINLAKEKIISTIPGNKELIDFDKSKIIYSLNNYNSDQSVATVNATFEGKITLKQDADIVSREKIIGLTKDQLNEYLGSLPELAGSEIRFSPSFISKVPDLVDRINIEIKR